MASSTQIRPFNWDDLNQFTDAFNQLNHHARSEKGVSVEYMGKFLSQPSCDPERHCFVAETGGRIVGYVLIAAEVPISRTVASGGVVEASRGRGIGRRLLLTAIDHAASLEVSVLHVQVSDEDNPAAALLKSESFEPVKRYWQMQWRDGTLPPLRLADGYSLRSFRLGKDEATLTEVQNAAFHDNWGFCPNTIEEIAARVRLDQPDGILFVMDGNRTVGYNWTIKSHSSAAPIGWIAMTGVHPDYRGQGLGKAIVVAGVRHLKCEGSKVVELEVDSDNAPARDLYTSLGFERVRETVWYEKRLGADGAHSAVEAEA